MYVNKGDFLFSFDLKSGYHHFDISQTIRHFWVFPGFFPVLLNIFALQFFLLILVRRLIFLPNSLDPLLSFEVLMVFNDSCVSGQQVRQGNIFFWKNNIVSLDSRVIMPYQAPFFS